MPSDGSEGCSGRDRSASGGEPAGLFVQERAVHQEQGLLRYGGHEPPRAGRVGHGEVEGAVKAVEVLAVDEAVDGAPGARTGLAVIVTGRPPDRRVEAAGNRQERVAHGLEVEPLAG